MSVDNISLLVEAKTEYTNQLIKLLKKPLYEGFKSLYDDSVNICKNNNEKNFELKTFQNLLGRIPQWNQEIIEKECDRIKISSDCEWIENLISAVFISHTKVLSSNVKGKNKINLSIPVFTKFIHKIYIDIARQFWRNPFLFSNEDISQYEYQKNIRECENIIEMSILETIRILLPVKNILKEYLGDSYDISEEDKDITKEDNLDRVKKMMDNDSFLKNISLDTSIINKKSHNKNIDSIDKLESTENTDNESTSAINNDDTVELKNIDNKVDNNTPDSNDNKVSNNDIKKPEDVIDQKMDDKVNDSEHTEAINDISLIDSTNTEMNVVSTSQSLLPTETNVESNPIKKEPEPVEPLIKTHVKENELTPEPTLTSNATTTSTAPSMTPIPLPEVTTASEVSSMPMSSHSEPLPEVATAPEVSSTPISSHSESLPKVAAAPISSHSEPSFENILKSINLDNIPTENNTSNMLSVENISDDEQSDFDNLSFGEDFQINNLVDAGTPLDVSEINNMSELQNKNHTNQDVNTVQLLPNINETNLNTESLPENNSELNNELNSTTIHNLDYDTYKNIINKNNIIQEVEDEFNKNNLENKKHEHSFY